MCVSRDETQLKILRHSRAHISLLCVNSQKNGGALLSDMSQADYVVLSRSEKEFEHLLPMVPPGKPVISPAWIHACDESGSRVDIQPYLENAVAMAAAKVSASAPKSSTKKRKFAPTSTSVTNAMSSKTNAADIESIAPPPKRKKKSRNPSSGPSSASASTSYASGSVDARRSPTPPTVFIKHSRGYMYTPEDNEFMFKSIRAGMERDLNVSRNKMTAWLAKKVGHGHCILSVTDTLSDVQAPHHSIQSWHSHLHRCDSFTTARRVV